MKAIEGGKVGQPAKDPLKPRIESRKDGARLFSVNSNFGRNKPNAPVVGIPRNGERSDQRQAVLFGFLFCGCRVRLSQSRFTADATLMLTLSGT